MLKLNNIGPVNAKAIASAIFCIPILNFFLFITVTVFDC